MAEISKPLIQDLWGEEGATSVPSSSKIREGWVSEIPPYTTQNWWQNRVDRFIRHIYQRGILEWDGNEEYFKDKSYVNVNGKLYVAIVNNVDKYPPVNLTYWKRTGLDFDDLPISSTSQQGIVQLYNALDSGSSSVALTAGMGKNLNDSKINKTDIVDGLGGSGSDKVLSANQGTVLNNIKIGYSDIEDSLVSSNASKVLSANQGKILNDSKVGKTTTINGYALSSNITLNKSDILLGNVDNIQQMPLSYLDTDGTLSNDSDTKVPSQKAVREFVGTRIRTVDIVNNLVTNSDTKVLSAAQGKLLQDNKANKSDIVNNLTTSSSSKMLSASMGRSLQDNKLDISSVKGSVLLGNDSINPPSQNAVKVYVDNKVDNLVPTGTIVWWPSGSVPAGWLKCNGANLSTTTYSKLYSVIGNTFGGSGGTFNVPDIRGRFIRGVDEGAGIDVGRVLGSIQSDDNKSHNHTGTTGNTDLSHSHSGTTNANNRSHTHSGTVNPSGEHSHHYLGVTDVPGPVDNGGGFRRGDRYTSPSGVHTHAFTTGGESQNHTHTFSTGLSLGNHSHSITTNNSGGSESRPHNIALIAIIKY